MQIYANATQRNTRVNKRNANASANTRNGKNFISLHLCLRFTCVDQAYCKCKRKRKQAKRDLPANLENDLNWVCNSEFLAFAFYVWMSLAFASTFASYVWTKVLLFIIKIKFISTYVHSKRKAFALRVHKSNKLHKVTHNLQSLKLPELLKMWSLFLKPQREMKTGSRRQRLK